jgi:glycosyltransferase involved in cell wall biosynthesis
MTVRLHSPLLIDPAAQARPGTILQVVPALMTGGVERGTLDVAAALHQAGYGSLVASSGGAMVHELTRNGSQHFTLPVDAKMPWKIRANIKPLTDLIEAENVDIVHARSRAPAWAARAAARRTGRIFVTTFHGTYNYSSTLKWHYNAIMTKGDCAIAISQFIAEHMIQRYAVDPARIRVIPRGIDQVVFDPTAVAQPRIIALANQWRLEDGVKVILLPGRLTRWKGHTVLIEALSRLPHRDFVCLLVGSEGSNTRYRQELERLVMARGLGGSVRIVGECRDMAAAYMLGDLVVSASTDPEAFGRVAAEASAMGRPVVATNHGGARETVIDGETGWLVKPGDPDAMAAAIGDALALTPEQRQGFAERGRRHILANFTKQRMCASTLELYAELLAGRSRPASGS